MSNRPSVPTIAIAGAAAIGAGFIGFAALHTTTQPPARTPLVALTAGEADIYLPDLADFQPTVAQGFPPLYEELQGSGFWSLTNGPTGSAAGLDGIDTQTTFGSFVNDDFLVKDGVEVGLGHSLPGPGSEFDLMNFGGGFESEWASVVDSAGGHTITDTLITPFGNYTIPLGSTAAEPGAAIPADAFSTVLGEIQTTIAAGQEYFPEAAEQFADGYYVDGLNLDFAGLNTFVFGVQADVVEGGYAALTGGNFGAESITPFYELPLNFAGGLDEAQSYLADAQLNLSAAFTEFAGNNTLAGLQLFDQGTEYLGFAPESLILGLVAALTTVSN
jgi:hypothetical protein